MNHDPFGLGFLLYGMRPTHVLTASAWTVGPLEEREFELAHAGCSISTFCKNPLHPGPCKGWKKSLGVNAPGALTAIESARAEKLAARRVKTAEAKSAAAKRVAALHSPLHAKKSLTKHANILLGDHEAKASSKADKVILNKQEIKKYSKIKDAQVNGILTSHGLPQDTGLEDRLAEALAKDNETGKDDNYRAVLASTAASLGAHLADKHCKKLDGDCDGKLFEGLRDSLTSDAEHAVLTGDTSTLDKALADYKSGKWSPAPKVEPTVMQGDKLSGPAKHTSGGDKPAVPEAGLAGWAPGNKYTTVKGMGLKPGDQVMIHLNKPGHDLKAGTPATVEKTANGYKFVDSNGNVLQEVKPGSKLVLSPLPGAEKHTPGGAPDTGATPTSDPGKLLSASVPMDDGAAVNVGKKISKEQWDRLTPAQKIKLVGAVGKAKDNSHPEADDAMAHLKDLASQAAQSSAVPFNVTKAKELFAGTYNTKDAQAPKKLALLTDMSKDEYAQLSPGEKEHIDAFLTHMDAKFGKTGGQVSKNLAKLHDKLGVGPAPTPALVPTPDLLQKLINDVPTAPSAPAGQLKKMLANDSTTPTSEIGVQALHAMTQQDWDGLDADEQTNASSYLFDAVQQGIPGAKEAVAHLSGLKYAASQAPKPAAPAKPPSQDLANAVAIAHGGASTAAAKKLVAYEKVTGDEFKTLPVATQNLILADLLKIKDKLTFTGNKKNAQAHFDYLSKYTGGGAGAGGGGAIPEAQKLAAGKAAVLELNKLTSNNPAGAHTAAAFENFVKATGQAGAADSLGPFFADTGLAWLNTKHPTLPVNAKDIVDSTKEPLAADMTTALKGEGQPTPVLNAFEKAVKSGSMDDLENFLLAADSYKPGAPASTSTAPSPAVPGITPASLFGPGASNLGTYAEQPSYDVPSLTGSHTHDQILFSAYKSAHKGTVLSHSIEDNYQNLLAVAQHYRGREPGGPPAYSNDLSVLQVASVVDKEIAKSLGVANGNVLQKRIANWAATPAGAKYIEDHPAPLAKWADNLSGSGSGAAEAAKVGLKMGDPVGKRVQKPKLKVNGKAPKFDSTKTADDFRPLQAHEIQASQQAHMDASGTQWSPGQAESLANYTTGAYHEINPYLRGKSAGGTPIDGISDLGLERIALIQNGMRPLQQDTLLKRGTDWEFLPPEYRSFAGAQKLIGKSVTEDAFMSTTVGGEFGEFGGDVKLFIEAPKGSPAAWVNHISHNPGEHEVVLAAGTKYKILDVTQDGAQVTMRVRVVG